MLYLGQRDRKGCVHGEKATSSDSGCNESPCFSTPSGIADIVGVRVGRAIVHPILCEPTGNSKHKLTN